MIIKTYPNKNLYGKYFLATEAPDDETVTDDQPKPKRNVKVITVKPSNRRKDFTAGIEDDPDDIEPTPQEDTAEDTTETKPTVQGDTTEDETPDEQPEAEEDNTDFTAGADEDEEGETSDDPDTEETGEEGPSDEDNTDFTAGADDVDDTDDTPAENTTQQTNNEANKPSPPGVEFDSTRKYNLYKEYMSLYNACDNYISKLENILKNDYEANQIIRISVTNLREIKDILFDYMTIRFQLNSYVQSLLFYQKMVVAIQLVFNLLKSINSKEKS